MFSGFSTTCDENVTDSGRNPELENRLGVDIYSVSLTRASVGKWGLTGVTTRQGRCVQQEGSAISLRRLVVSASETLRFGLSKPKLVVSFALLPYAQHPTRGAS